MELPNHTKRTRVSFKISTKGVITPEVLVERLDSDNETVLKEAEDLLEKAMKIVKSNTEEGGE